MEVGGRVQVSLGFVLQNSPKPVLIFWSSIPYILCILFVYTLLTCVSYYDLRVLTMSVIGFKKNWMWGGWVGGWVDGVNSIQCYFGMLLTLQSP